MANLTAQESEKCREMGNTIHGDIAKGFDQDALRGFLKKLAITMPLGSVQVYSLRLQCNA